MIQIADTSSQDVKIEPKKRTKPAYIAGAIIFIAIVLVVFLGPQISRWSNSQISVSAERLRISTVTRGDFIRDLSVQGQVVAAISPKLYSPARGTITFQVNAGDSVSTNQVLATISSPELTNQLEQDRATLQKMEIDLERQKITSDKRNLQNQKVVDLANVKLVAAQREKRRADKAFQNKSISEIDYEKAKDELQNAELEHKHATKDAQLDNKSAKFELQTAQLLVDRQRLLVKELERKVNELTLRSPTDGIVGNLAVDQKSQVNQDSAIMSVVNLSEFQLEIAIPESYAYDISIGMPTEVNLNGRKYNATLVSISPEIKNNQVTGIVRFTADEQPDGLRQNQRLTTRILLEDKKNVLMVERGQFLESGGGKLVYVVNDGIAQRRAIVTGARSLAKVEIVSGLQPGDKVVTSSTEVFRSAESVLITNYSD